MVGEIARALIAPTIVTVIACFRRALPTMLVSALEFSNSAWVAEGSLRTLDIVAAWLLIAFGALHTSLTRKVHPDLDINAVWFASGGLLIIVIGALNLLRVAYSSIAKGLGAVSVIANIVLLLLMAWIATLIPMRGNPQVSIGLVLAGVLTVFSVLRWQERN
jgi:hypothetical protein